MKLVAVHSFKCLGRFVGLRRFRPRVWARRWRCWGGWGRAASAAKASPAARPPTEKQKACRSKQRGEGGGSGGGCMPGNTRGKQGQLLLLLLLLLQQQQPKCELPEAVPPACASEHLRPAHPVHVSRQQADTPEAGVLAPAAGHDVLEAGGAGGGDLGAVLVLRHLDDHLHAGEVAVQLLPAAQLPHCRVGKGQAGGRPVRIRPGTCSCWLVQHSLRARGLAGNSLHWLSGGQS